MVGGGGEWRRGLGDMEGRGRFASGARLLQ